MESESLKLSGLCYSCNICNAWIAESKGITVDGVYARFCSAECLEKWRVEEKIKEEEKKMIQKVE